MTKPDDVSQEAWEAAELALIRSDWPRLVRADMDNAQPVIARAIDAAKAEQREADAKVADRFSIEPDPDEVDPYDDYEMGMRTSARSIARAIRGTPQ